MRYAVRVDNDDHCNYYYAAINALGVLTTELDTCLLLRIIRQMVFDDFDDNQYSEQ